VQNISALSGPPCACTALREVSQRMARVCEGVCALRQLEAILLIQTRARGAPTHTKLNNKLSRPTACLTLVVDGIGPRFILAAS